MSVRRIDKPPLDLSEFRWIDGFTTKPESLSVVNGYLCGVSFQRRAWVWVVSDSDIILQSGLSMGAASMRTAKIRAVCTAYQYMPGPHRPNNRVLDIFLREISAVALLADSSPAELFSQYLA